MASLTTGISGRCVAESDRERPNVGFRKTVGDRPTSVHGVTPLDVELLYIDGCPNWEVTAINLSVALQATGHGDTQVDLRRIDTVEDAEEVGFTGSPMIRINGVKRPGSDGGSQSMKDESYGCTEEVQRRAA